MLEEVLIRHSAPTLAGLKTANLFWYSWESKEEFENSAELWKRVLKEKGLSLTVIRTTEQRALLYVDRRKKLEDVQGFIENQGKNCKCCGCWKVYCNECDAQKMFCKFKKCETVYERLFSKGRPVEKMIVAA